MRRKYAKRTFRRKKKFSRKPSKRLTRAVKTIITKSSEKKTKVYQNTTTVDNTGYLLKLNEISQGDGDSNRNGDQVCIRSVQINFNAYLADTTNFVRFIAFQWYPSSSLAYPGIGDILVDSINYPFMSPYNHDKRFMFKILRDKLVKLDTDNPTQMVKFFIKGGFKRKIQFIETSSVNYTNGIYILMVSDSSAATHPTVLYSGKLNYSDY